MTSSSLTSAHDALEAAVGGGHLVDLSWIVPERQRDGWTLNDDSLRFLAALVPRLRPRHVVEFGSGVSTRVLAAAAAGLDEPASVLALESDPVFERRTRGDLVADAHGVARVELSHLVVRRWFGRNMPVYDLPASVLRGPPPQLVLVDGPPLPLGGRQGSLFQAVHLAEPGTLVLLDDADRPSERAALELTSEVFGDAIDVVRLSGFTKGLAAVVVQRAVGGSAMPPAPPPHSG